MKAVDSTIQVNLRWIRGCISCIHFLLVFGLMPALVLAVDELPVILCSSCYQVESYYSVMEGETLTCSFSAITQVQLEWFQQSSDGYSHVEMQSFNITENESGTYNSLATLELLSDDDNLIHSLVCRATQPNSDWRQEKEILVDISRNESFSDIEPETQYMDLNTYTLIPCGGLSSSYMIWKKIISSGNPELVGFHLHIMTRTTTSALDIEVSTDGSLVFQYIGVHNEGMYACISGDGLNEEINVTSVEILIPPSPPYINITGCDDVFQRCLLTENTTKVLECTVRGVRPAATLEWIAEDANQISFFNHSIVSNENNDTFDTILSVEYEVSQDVLCGEEIFVQCNPHEPLSELIEAEATAFILPASCKKNKAADSGAFTSWKIIFIFWTVYSVFWMFEFIFILWKSRKGKEKTANSRVVFVADKVMEVIRIIFRNFFTLFFLVWIWLSRKAYGLITTWEMVLFIFFTVFSTVFLMFDVVLSLWESCNEKTANMYNRVVSLYNLVVPVQNIVNNVIFVAVLVWFLSLWTAGLTIWEIVLFIILTVSAVFRMFCKLWIFRLSCKRNEQTANSKAGIVNRVILIISNEVWYLVYSVWFLSFWQASDSGLTPWEILLFIFLTVWSVLKAFRAVCLLWLSFKGIEVTAACGVAYLANIVLGVNSILRRVVFLAVSVWFWLLWKESEETAMKVLIMVSLVCQSVFIVLVVYDDFGFWAFYCAKARRRCTQNAAFIWARTRIRRTQNAGNREPSEPAESLPAQNGEGNREPSEAAESLSSQNGEELAILQRLLAEHMESMRRTVSAESSSLLNGEGNGQPIEHAESLSLQNVEGSMEPNEHDESFPLQNGEGYRELELAEHVERLPLQNVEGNDELAPTENAERLSLQNVEGNGQSIEHAERLPLQNAEDECARA